MFTLWYIKTTNAQYYFKFNYQNQRIGLDNQTAQYIKSLEPLYIVLMTFGELLIYTNLYYLLTQHLKNYAFTTFGRYIFLYSKFRYS